MQPRRFARSLPWALRQFLLACPLVLAAAAPQTVLAQGTANPLLPVADATVRDGTYTNVNYGSANPLVVKKQGGSSYNRWTYLKFDLSSINVGIAAAQLQLFGKNQSAGYSATDTAYFVSNSTWTESAITWANKPALGAAQSKATITSVGQYNTWDLSSIVKSEKAAGRNLITIAISMDAVPTASTSSDEFNSKEAPNNLPQLVVYTPPPAPVVTASSGDTQVTLSWPDVSGAASYNLYRSATPGGEGPTPYQTGVTSPKIDTGLTDGATYYYQLTAVNSAGVSPRSAEVSGSPTLSVPTLTGTPDDSKANLSWTTSLGASSYNLYRSTTPGGEGSTPYLTGAVSPTVDTGLADGVAYYYQVTAVNSNGATGKSNEVAITPLPPPPTLSGIPGNGQVNLSWTASNGAVGYNVKRSTTSGGPYSVVAPSFNNTSYTDNNVKNGATYYYVVSAVSATAEGLNSNQVAETPTGTEAFGAIADSYVRDGAFAAANYGGSAAVTIKKQTGTGYNRWAYFKFDLSGVSGNVTQAKLRLYGNNLAAGAYSATDTVYFVPDNSWSETGINWSNKPALGAAQSISTITQVAKYYEWDLSQLVTNQIAAGQTTLSLAVLMDGYPASQQGDQFRARESTTNPPKLVITSYPTIAVGVNFQPASSPTPGGFIADTGLSYDSTRGFGWIREDSVSGGHVPLDVSPNTRDRQRAGIDPLLNTILHMQYPADTVNYPGNTPVRIPAAWDYSLPNGNYNVTVSVGDQMSAKLGYDSQNTINVQGVNAVNQFVGSSGQEYTQATIPVTVTNGRLTIDAIGGVNTKIDYVTFTNVGVPQLRHPFVSGTAPINGQTNVFRDTAVNADISLPNVGAGIDPGTITTANIQLYRTSDHALVAGVLNTDAAGDTIAFQPSAALDASTNYTFTISPNVLDTAGASIVPFTLAFTTGATSSISTNPNVNFARTVVYTGEGPASTLIGPDHKLYASFLTGYIRRWTLDSVGNLSNPETFSGFAGRVLIGITFDPNNPNVLWVVNNDPFVPFPANDFTGRISKVTLAGPGFNGTVQDYIVGLPRSAKDHMTNSIAFGPDGLLYCTQGSNSDFGAPDNAWFNRPERLLTAAVLQINPRVTTGLPINVQTEPYQGTTGSYDPYAPGAPVRLFGTGLRNAYDLVWHSNGWLYCPTNGGSAGGNTPASPSGVTPSVPALIAAPTQRDYVFHVQQGKYYGHPNAARRQYVLGGGNPTAGFDPAEVVTSGVNQGYSVGIQPDPNYGYFAWELGRDRSPDGSIEYKSNTFNGALAHDLLICEYSSGDDIIALQPAPDRSFSSATLVYSGLDNPVDLTEDTRNGNLYVCELNNDGESGQISMLRPIAPKIAVSPTLLAFNGVVNSGATAPRNVVITNQGLSTLNVSSITLSGTDAAQFSITNQPGLPAAIPPGGSAAVSIAFSPASTGPKGAQIQIQSDDSITPSVTVVLRGLGTTGTSGAGEPSLQSILDTFGIPVSSGTSDPTQNGLPGSSSPIGDELLIQRFQKAGPGSVTIQPIAVFGPTDPGSGLAALFGWYKAGAAASVQPLFSAPNGSAQQVNPTVSGLTSFDPGSTRFAFYSGWPAYSGRRIFQEDALNTFTGAIPHNVRVYPLKNGDGSIAPNSYILAFEAGTGPSYTYANMIVIVSNVTPASGQITTENLDGTPYADRLVFNRIGSLASPPANGVHYASTLRIHNVGLDPLQITGLPVTGPWIVSPAVALPAAVPAGGVLDIPVQFTAESGRVTTGQLTIQSNVPDQQNLPIQLGGYWQSISEGGQEPTLTEIIQGLYGYGTVIVGSGQRLANNGHVEAVGDEILSPYWRAADTTQPVSVRQLDTFHTYPRPATIFWYTKGAPSPQNNLFTQLPADSQSLLPRLNGAPDMPAAGAFSPSGAFGLKVDGEWSDDLLNSHQADLNNGGVEPLGHHMRFWPLRDRQGFLVPNSYIMSMDYGGINYDYNDNCYLISNITPDNEDLTAYVNPFIGTSPGTAVVGGTTAGGTFPGAESPFGMVQLSPDTPAPEAGGYSYNATTIVGFSHTHMSGAGGPLYGVLPFFPTVGAVTTSTPAQYGAAFTHSLEYAAPGYYKVGLGSGVLAELTTSTHVGWHRYTFPQGAQANILINVGQAFRTVKNASFSVVNGNTVEGFVTSVGPFSTIGSDNPTPYTVYFSAQFDHPIAGYGTWTGPAITAGSPGAAGSNVGGYVSFDTSASTAVIAKVGISFTSLNGARANLASEAPSFDFNGAAVRAHGDWNTLLHRVEATGRVTPNTRTAFYTALYHSLLHPNVFSDVDGTYAGFDNQIHTAQGYTQYANFSLWDTYRTQNPLLELVAPERAHDIAQSLMSVYQEGGWLPRWTIANTECNEIVGDPVSPILVDDYLKGIIPDLNAENVYQALVHNATQVPPAGSPFEGRLGLGDYTGLGWVGFVANPTAAQYKLKNAGTTTLEYARSDGDLALMARSLGHTSDLAMFAARGRNYRNQFNPVTGFTQPRLSNGSFVTPFDPTSQIGFKEGTAWQYTWMVPQDMAGVIAQLGGPAAAEANLDHLFGYAQIVANPGVAASALWTGGDQYNPYNESDFQAPYAYEYVSKPWKTDLMIQKAQTLFTNAPTGIPGNDDLGTMSAWYVLSSLGLYPFFAGDNFYTLNAPAFDHTVIHLHAPYYNAPTLTIDAPRTPGATQYVQSLTVGGAPWNQAWVNHLSLWSGSSLSFTLGAAPSAWASDPASLPPSPLH